jgi:hypothetical protein
MIAVVLAFVTLYGPAAPQFTVEPFPGPRLITEAGIRQEMGITKEWVYDLIERHRSEFNKVQTFWWGSAMPYERRRAMDKILVNFSPVQRERLGQLYIWVHEGAALLEPSVAAKLKLTFRQRRRTQEVYDQSSLGYAKEIGRVRDKVYKEMNYTPPPPSYHLAETKSRMDIPRYVQEALQKERPYLEAWRQKQMQATHNQALSLLNQRQKEEFEKMKGRAPSVPLRDPTRPTLP